MENGELTQSGTLHKGIGVPFTMRTTVTVPGMGRFGCIQPR
jgi:hypothetical protein